MSAPITKTISPFIESQLPEFIKANDPTFAQFIKAYYEWMEQSGIGANSSGIITQSKSLLSYIDIDSTLDQFLQYYINDFLPYFPNETALDERKLIKAARNFYQKKGSIESVQFLFRVLYNKEADIYFPKNQILRCSDGKWTLPQALNILVDTQHVNFNFQLLVGRQGLGANSNASCVIEAATLTVDQGLGIELLQLYISNIEQTFDDLENLNVIYGYDSNNNPLIFSSKIIASLSNILINPNYRGTLYKGIAFDGIGNILYHGDPVSIIQGLKLNDPSAQKAVAYVNSVTSGSITGVNVAFGGFGYRVNPNTIISVINAPNDTTGTGANLVVEAIDTNNLIFLNVSTDTIEYEQGVFLNATNYNFANAAYANANTLLGSAFSFANIPFASLTEIQVVNGGGGFTAVPSLNLEVTYYTDYLVNLVANSVATRQNMQFVDDLGIFCNVVVANAGNGYSNVTDTIVVQSAIGYGAVFNFITNGSGGLTQILITNPGQGYVSLPMSLAIVNSVNVMNASAGVGANIIGYGYGQGANLTLATDQIGQIIDFRLPSRGFDYISTPNVSLRVADLVINTILFGNTFITDGQVYQGSNLLAASWIANVDSYNVSSNVLRVYNYQGALSPYANISTPTFNVTINTSVTNNVTIYGDGLAKANAIFQNGLISFPGFYLTTDGFLSSDQYLQDSETYHNYSYMIVVEKALIEYKQALLNIVHPIGTSMLGTYSVIQNNHNILNSNSNVNIIPVVSGTVNANAFGNGYIVGTGTSFGSFGNVGDMIVFNTSDTTRSLQTKIIKTVVNSSYILTESNTMFFHYGIGNTVQSSNVINAVNVFGNVGIGDVVKVDINSNSNIVTTNVKSVLQNVIIGDTIFDNNYSNVVIFVYPSINNASYAIIEAAT